MYLNICIINHENILYSLFRGLNINTYMCYVGYIIIIEQIYFNLNSAT